MDTYEIYHPTKKEFPTKLFCQFLTKLFFDKLYFLSHKMNFTDHKLQR